MPVIHVPYACVCVSHYVIDAGCHTHTHTHTHTHNTQHTTPDDKTSGVPPFKAASFPEREGGRERE